jgi:arylsulfatase A-like enzyme
VVHTDAIDAFAAEAVLFEDCYSTANITNPSHVSMFTSLYMKDHGVKDNMTKLDPSCPTMMENLMAERFLTAAFVSAFNFTPDRSDLNTKFSEFYGCRVYHERRAEDVNLDVLPWLGRHYNDDFFIWIHYFDVHMPYAPPFPYNTLHRDRGTETIELPLRKAGLEMYSASDSLHYYENMYKGEVAYLDDRFGELIDQLRALDVYDRSLIVVTSDHGESLGENRIYCEHNGLYENTTSVPLLIKTPRQESTGRVDGLVSSVDIYPTIFDYLDLPIGHRIRGRSLRQLMETGQESPQQTAYSEHGRQQQVSVRTPRYRSMLGLKDARLFPRFSIEKGKLELFDLDDPSGEQVDISGEDTQTSRTLKANLEAFMSDRLDFSGLPIDDEEYREKLRSLGYID